MLVLMSVSSAGYFGNVGDELHGGMVQQYDTVRVASYSSALKYT